MITILRLIALILILLAIASCDDQEEKEDRVRAAECKYLCVGEDWTCPGKEVTACAMECEAYQWGESYCPPGGE